MTELANSNNGKRKKIKISKIRIMKSKKLIKYLTDYRCQLCNDEHGKVYEESGVKVELQAHHIKPKSEGGATKLYNLVALCDFCHAVVTPQRWEEYFGLTKNGIDINEMTEIKKVFEECIRDIGNYHKEFIRQFQEAQKLGSYLKV